ncbi:replication/maintenance protein RepL, partial [Bacillus toyonensis]
WLITNHHLSSNILFFFLENMNNRNVIVCSQQLLMEQFNKGRTTIHNAIKTLKEHGFISVAKIGNANAYIINPEIAFQDSRDKIKYVSFEGKILINKNENEELFKEHNFENLKVLKDEKK